METLRTHVAGVDVHKAKLSITVLRGPADSKPEEHQFECETFTEDLIKTGQKLLDMGVREVAMESTGIYWKPIHNVWSPMGLILTVAQAAHVKNVPGRKTDMNDSQWLANLHRHGLIRPSLIPDGDFQSIRMLTRHRKNLVGDLARVKNRIQKILEDGNVKWGSIVSDVFGKSGLNVLTLIAAGTVDAPTLASAVTTNIRRKKDAKRALRNCLTREHIFTIKELMGQYYYLKDSIANTDERLVELIAPYRHLVDALKQVPGIDEILAMGILGESTNDMGNFTNERHYAAWAGVAAGNNESAGKKKRAKCRRGNPNLKWMLIQAANGAVKKKKSFYKSKYNRLRFRLGSANKAKVAIANRLARVVHKILGGEKYRDLGYARGAERDEKRINYLLSQLKNMGLKVHQELHEVIVSEKIKVSSAGEILS